MSMSKDRTVVITDIAYYIEERNEEGEWVRHATRYSYINLAAYPGSEDPKKRVVKVLTTERVVS